MNGPTESLPHTPTLAAGSGGVHVKSYRLRVRRRACAPTRAVPMGSVK
jgi:hypothetical protein